MEAEQRRQRRELEQGEKWTKPKSRLRGSNAITVHVLITKCRTPL